MRQTGKVVVITLLLGVIVAGAQLAIGGLILAALMMGSLIMRMTYGPRELPGEESVVMFSGTTHLATLALGVLGGMSAGAVFAGTCHIAQEGRLGGYILSHCWKQTTMDAFLAASVLSTCFLLLIPALFAATMWRYGRKNGLP